MGRSNLRYGSKFFRHAAISALACISIAPLETYALIWIGEKTGDGFALRPLSDQSFFPLLSGYLLLLTVDALFIVPGILAGLLASWICKNTSLVFALSIALFVGFAFFGGMLIMVGASIEPMLKAPEIRSSAASLILFLAPALATGAIFWWLMVKCFGYSIQKSSVHDDLTPVPN